MRQLQSYKISQAFPSESISFCEEILPGFTIIRNKIVRCNYFHTWKSKYIKSSLTKNNPTSKEKRNQMKYLSHFIFNCREQYILKKCFRKWKQQFENIKNIQLEDKDSNSYGANSVLGGVNIDPKYVEFMSDLQETISQEAHLKTTISVIDKKVNELLEVEHETRKRADKILRKCDIASSTFENLLRQLSEMKINHRDHVAALQLQISKKIEPNSFNSSDMSNVLYSLQLDQAKFQDEKEKIQNLINQEKEKAAVLRTQLDLFENENNEQEKELKDLKDEIDVFPDPQYDPYIIEPNSRMVELRKLLMQADQQLEATSVILEKQNAQINELDLQIIKKRTILEDLKRPPIPKMKSPKARINVC